MPKLNWQPYPYGKSAEGYPVTVAMAGIVARNGAYGGAFIVEYDGEYYLTAGGNDTGRSWKTPDESYPTLEAAQEAADKLWKPASEKGLPG